MTPSEFKAWFQGFTEALEGVPSEAQWTRIKARVAEIDGRAITEHIYVNRYMPHDYPNYWGGPLYYNLCGSGISTGAGSTNLTASSNGGVLNAGGNAGMGGAAFDSHAAMLSLGRAEAQGLIR